MLNRKADMKSITVKENEFKEFLRIGDFTFQFFSNDVNTETEFETMRSWFKDNDGFGEKLRIISSDTSATPVYGRAFLVYAENYNSHKEHFVSSISITVRILQ